MSTLIKDMDGVSIQCDMDYSKYVSGGINYVPCTLTTDNAELILKVLVNYISNNKRYSVISINLISKNSLEVKIPRTLLESGKSFGEFIDLILYMTIGIRECMRVTGNG